MSQRTADADLNLDLEELGLDWKQDGPWEGEYMTILPAIPGYTQPGDPYNIAEVYPVNPSNPYEGFDFHIYASTSDGEINLYSSDFGLPLSENAGDAMATVGDIPIGSLIEAFEDDGIEPDEPEYHHEARKGARAKHATRRKASLDLQWYDEIDDYDHLFYYAELPEIPGYTDVDENESYAQVYLMEDYSDIPGTPGYEKGKWGFRLLIDDIQGPVNLYAADFNLLPAGSADEAMNMVDSLTIQDIQDAMGAGEPVTARRTASMDLTWVKNDGDPVLYEALLPPIPGYTQDDSDLTVDNTAVAYVYQDRIAGYWDCDIIYGRDMFGVTESNLGHALGRSADEMMMFINSLTPETIAEVLDEYGHDLHPRW